MRTWVLASGPAARLDAALGLDAEQDVTLNALLRTVRNTLDRGWPATGLQHLPTLSVVSARDHGLVIRDARREPGTGWVVLVVAALLLAVAAPAAVANAPVVRQSRADATEGGVAGRASEAVGAQMAASRVPAAAWAVLDGDRVVLGARGGGVDGNTAFVLGSVSKSFTALAVTQLVDRDLVRLDAPVSDYLPGFTTASPGAVITVRQLLDQTSGLPTSAGLALLLRPRESLEQRVRAASSISLESEPGKEFHYCNLNFAVLGLVVQRVSGQPFGAYVQQQIFAPLKMERSHASLSAARAAGLETGSTPWFGLDVPTRAAAVPGGGPDGYLVSTAADMARYLTFQLGDGTAGGRRIVSAQGLALMHSRQVITPPGVAAAKTSAYGLGWALGSVQGQPLIAHDGDVPGYHATVALLPRQDRAMVVLVGRGGSLADADASYRAGLVVLAGGPAAPLSRAFQHAAAIVAAIAAITLVLLLATSLRRWRRLRSGASTSRSLRWAAARDLVGALALCLLVVVGAGLALQGGALDPRIALAFAPDVTSIVAITAATLAARAIATLWWAPGTRSAPRTPRR